jgi:hypothetical protein
MGEGKRGMSFLYFVILVFKKVGKKCFPMLNVFFWVFFFLVFCILSQLRN